ncbi:MAG: YfhO family protein [Candidatus Omnitrophica bacterium]|nr:YfhO family protein [Candidatus Omnitrophota bacterium]
MKNIIYIALLVVIAFYLIYPLLAGNYMYVTGEYDIYKSFMVNFIDSLKKGVLPTWNEYVGCGSPAMLFGHYPISQNTIFYMLFGYNEFNSYFVRFLNLLILLSTFIYACKFLKFSYWLALLGALVYFSVNFVTRFIITDTIGNVHLVYPLLAILIIKIIQDYNKKDILIFSLFYILWLSGAHITYFFMPLTMLFFFYWVAIFVLHKPKIFKLQELRKYIGLCFMLFIVPLSAVLYQYYYIYDVLVISNRIKQGLIVSPFQPVAWEQLAVSFRSSSYIWVGVSLFIIYIVFKVIISKYKSFQNKKLNIFFIWLVALTGILLLFFPEKSLSLLRPLGLDYTITASNGSNSNYRLVKLLKENLIPGGGFSGNANGWKTNLAALSIIPDGQSGSCLKITTTDDAIGYAYYAFATKPKQMYKISVFYKKGTAANGQIKVGTSIDDTSLYYSDVISNAEWRRYDGSFQATGPVTYLTLVDLTSLKGETSYFDTVALYELKPSVLSDGIPLLKSTVFKISLFLFFLINTIILYKKRKSFAISLPEIFSLLVIFIIYISMLSYYFFSPENIIGDVNGYDFDLFREMSFAFQIIFTFCVLYSIKAYRNNKIMKIMLALLIILYLMRSHFTILLLRFTGFVWYATRDGVIFSLIFSVLFMFGLKQLFKDFLQFFKYNNKENAVFIKNCFLASLIILFVWDCGHKFYKGTSHRYVFGAKDKICSTARERGYLAGKREIVLLNNELLELDKLTKHFYRTFTPENNFLYLAGELQQYKIYEAAIYESSISKEMYDFFNYTILGKNRSNAAELKDVLPYFLFTKHVHAGLGLTHKEIMYSDFFMFNPKTDAEYLKNQNIEFLWDIAQVKYLIIGPEFSDALDNFNDKENYKLLGRYRELRLNLYEIIKNKNYSKLAVYPLADKENQNEIIENMNSTDIKILKSIYSKLIFLDQYNADFELSKNLSGDNTRYYKIDSKKRGILIDFESYNRNWRLNVNNKNQKLNKAFQIFKAVSINPGINEIKLEYKVKYFKELFLLSIIVIFIYVSLLIRIKYVENNQ